MPGRIRKTRHGYSVSWGGRVVAKHTTKPRAQRQLRLLRALEHGFKKRY